DHGLQQAAQDEGEHEEAMPGRADPNGDLHLPINAMHVKKRPPRGAASSKHDAGRNGARRRVSFRTRA
ncbi:MAG TPA: hypothetical protein VFL86_08520, partial [Burkholderiaceae bacterium]|nr:hypothetical protein [Burkholderiaceae bacterium]